MFVKGEKRPYKARPSAQPTALSYWLKRCKVKLSELKPSERANLALEAWKIAVKQPTEKTARTTRMADAQRLINALEGSPSMPTPAEPKEAPLASEERPL